MNPFQSLTQKVAILLSVTWSIAAVGAVVVNPQPLQWLELKTHNWFVRWRGPVAAPSDVIILAIDDASLTQAQFYAGDPDRYQDLEPLQTWPWQRAAYAIAIERILEAGAKSIALDILFLRPSSYGEADDQALEQVLKRYRDQVVLGARYDLSDDATGTLCSLVEPLPRFRATGVQTGFINLPLAADSQIRQFGETFLDHLQNQPQPCITKTIPSFASAALQSAQINFVPPQVEDTLHLYGPQQSFRHIPFWQVIDSHTWNSSLAPASIFQDKIVLIGSTSPLHQDYHPTVFIDPNRQVYEMAGVEFQATAIANLLTQTRIKTVLADQRQRSSFALVVVLLLTLPSAFIPRPSFQLMGGFSVLALYLSLAYVGHNYLDFDLPTVIPILGILGFYGSHTSLSFFQYYQRQQRLRASLKEYASIPAVREIMSRDDELQSLLQEREAAIAGRVLAARYRIVKVLGVGGFSETYTAEDLQRPGTPICVVKQLRIDRNNPNLLSYMQRSFQAEAAFLEQLGKHPQVPQLLAAFEENEEFYLIQEFIEGISLQTELKTKVTVAIADTIAMLLDLLPVLDYIHSHNVIHRDLKPSNIVRRASDKRLVLLDFGIAKLLEPNYSAADLTHPVTMGIGTRGYMPPEQAAGTPHFSSDFYALGIIAIQMLTGLSPQELSLNAQDSLDWASHAPVLSPEFKHWLDKMTHQNFQQRYPSATLALAGLAEVEEYLDYQRNDTHPISMSHIIAPSAGLSATLPNTENTGEHDDTVTQPWPTSWQIDDIP